jgi:DNA repair protein RAD57
MSDILQVLTGFPTAPYSHILPSLDRASISTVDLITLTPQEIAKRAQVPPAEVAKLTEAATRALQDDNAREKTSYVALDFSNEGTVSSRISTLDSNIDALLEGGIRAGFITEITGERFVSIQILPM